MLPGIHLEERRDDVVMLPRPVVDSLTAPRRGNFEVEEFPAGVRVLESAGARPRTTPWT